MSTFTTRNGAKVVCEDPNCPCNRTKPEVAGSIIAADEERWFNHVCDAVEEYLSVLAQQQDAPKADRAAYDEKVHEAKREVIDRFYAMGWDQL